MAPPPRRREDSQAALGCTQDGKRRRAHHAGTQARRHAFHRGRENRNSRALIRRDRALMPVGGKLLHAHKRMEQFFALTVSS
jgi:hypothetical protein